MKGAPPLWAACFWPLVFGVVVIFPTQLLSPHWDGEWGRERRRACPTARKEALKRPSERAAGVRRQSPLAIGMAFCSHHCPPALSDNGIAHCNVP